MTLRYVALIRKEKTTDYWVDIPDLPGCVSSGETEEEAKTNFKKAMELHLDALRKDDKSSLPEPRSRDAVASAEEDRYVGDYYFEIEPP